MSEPDQREPEHDAIAPGDWAAATLVARLDALVQQALVNLRGTRLEGFVCSDVSAVQAALQHVVDKDLARGPVFCEWGSGIGAVCALAASLSFEAHGIEIQANLVDVARELVAELDLEATFVHGSFLQPGDEALVVGCANTRAEVSTDLHRDLGFRPDGADVVFAYPWPGEEAMHDRVFARHASPGALLLTYHENSRVLVQRHVGTDRELVAVEWVS